GGDLRQQGEEHGRGRAGHAGGEVVLGHPVAAVAELLGPAGQVEGVAQGLARRASRHDRGEVEDGQRHAAPPVPGKGLLGISARSTGATSAWNSSSDARCWAWVSPSASAATCMTSWPNRLW